MKYNGAYKKGWTGFKKSTNSGESQDKYLSVNISCKKIKRQV